jgi:hypothetical protein
MQTSDYCYFTRFVVRNYYSLDTKKPKNQERNPALPVGRDIQHVSFIRLDYAAVLLWLQQLTLEVILTASTLSNSLRVQVAVACYYAWLVVVITIHLTQKVTKKLRKNHIQAVSFFCSDKSYCGIVTRVFVP